MTASIAAQYADLRKKALERRFAHLNPEQRRAVFHISGPVLILAGAGSGKTTVLVNRICNMIEAGDAYHTTEPSFLPDEAGLQKLRAYVNGEQNDYAAVRGLIAQNPVRPWNILAITFTNKAAGELKERLEKSIGEQARDIGASTFHSACVRILRRDIEQLGYERSFTIYDRDDSLRVIKECMKALQIDEKRFPPNAVLSEMGKAKDSLQDPQSYLREAGDDFRLKTVAQIYEQYQKRLKHANALDFDDIITLTVKLLMEHPKILEHYQNRYQYIMVDEYQDTNHAQYMLVSLLSARHRNLCVVGDDDQSIYRFRGATIRNILDFENQFSNAAVIRLEQNYRSTKNILDCANSVIANNAQRKPKALWTEFGEGAKISLVRVPDEQAEGYYIAKQIQESVKQGAGFRDHAVLYRTNAQSNAVESALTRSGVPYRIVGGTRFYDRMEIKDAIAYLSIINNPADTLRLLRIVNSPKRGIGAATIEKAQQLAEEYSIPLFELFRTARLYPQLGTRAATLAEFAEGMDALSQAAPSAPLDAFFDEVMEKTGYRKQYEIAEMEAQGRLEHLEELKSNILKYMQSAPEPSLSGFLEEVALYTDIDRLDTDADAVTLMTIHASKGLEFGTVFIAGVEEGIFPSAMSMGSQQELEEERRLAYVAITRAKRRLYLLSAAQRMLYGRTEFKRPSMFLGEIDTGLCESVDMTVAAVSRQTRTPRAITPAGSASGIGIGIGVGSGLSGRKPAAVQSKATVSFCAGDRVEHKKFGGGMVLKASPMGGDCLLEIAFDSVGTKKIMANVAGLTKS